MNCGEPMLQTKPTPVSVTDDLVDVVVEHLARYRLTVFAALEQLPCFSACRPRQIKDVLRACQRQSLIGSAPLHHGAKYWYLAAHGARRCGLPEERIGPLSEPAKLRALAMLRFCCLSDSPRHRLTTDDLVRSFPDLVRPGLPDGYYFDPQGARPSRSGSRRRQPPGPLGPRYPITPRGHRRPRESARVPATDPGRPF